MHEQFSNVESNAKEQELQTALLAAEDTIAKLQRQVEQKDEFVSLATHQIRGPIGAIKGYASLILEGDYGNIPEYIIEPLHIIQNSSDTLSKTVNDFLDVSRLEQGGMRYYRKDFDFQHLVDEVIKEMKKSIDNTGLELKLSITHEPLLIHADKAKIKHVLMNLVDNAIKYTKEGWVKISLKKSAGNTILFCISDSGVGIKPETLPKLFQKFSRCIDADNTNSLGTGLGLYIARMMLEAQNGRIWAESEGEGAGSQFYVELGLVN